MQWIGKQLSIKLLSWLLSIDFGQLKMVFLSDPQLPVFGVWRESGDSFLFSTVVTSDYIKIS